MRLFIVTPWKLTNVPWKSMVGRCISYGKNPFLGDIRYSFRGCTSSWEEVFVPLFAHRWTGESCDRTFVTSRHCRKRLSTGLCRCPTWRMMEIQLKLLLVVLPVTMNWKSSYRLNCKNLQSACVKDEDFCKPVSNLSNKNNMFGLAPDVCRKLRYGKPTLEPWNNDLSNGKKKPGCLGFIGDEILPRYIGDCNKPWNKDPY